MTVRDEVGRTRYVAFRVEAAGPVSRGAMQDALPQGAKLTRFDGKHGIARTLHTQAAALVAALAAVTKVGGQPVTIRTLVTSGTLRAAARRLPEGSPASQRGRRPSRID
jgi:RNase P/RNase MRP subunit POP5